MSVKAFERKPPPRLTQYAAGFMIHGVFRPISWFLERSGRLPAFLAKATARRKQEMAKSNPFLRHQLGPQDVVVMTYAKSGTNWTMQIAHQLIYHARGDFEHIHEIVPWPDTAMMGGFMKHYAIPMEQADHWKSAPERKRVIKTHFNWDEIPYSPEARYIAVIRDPKDVFVSNYHFIGAVLGPSMPGVRAWLDTFIAGSALPGGSWAESTASYWAERNRENVLVLSFKDLRRNLRGNVERIAKFLAIDATPELIDEVTRLSSFDHMKKIDKKFAVGRVIPWQTPGEMIRKGQQGGSGEMLTPEMQRELDAAMMAQLKERSCDFPYEDFCELAK